jgi:non-specific serine/threonine protein kinase/serine/threonine-protein kinase
MITLYDGKPVPKVIDFGVAKATEQKLTEQTLFTQYGTMVGTFEYMSPEQAEMSALGVDTRSDIYSLGVLLYELLTGSTPLSHKRIKEAAYAEILRLIKEEEPPRPSTRLTDSGEALASISANRHTEPAKLTKLVRGELDWIVMKTLEKDRNRRYETASGFAADVQRYLSDEPVQACPPRAGYRLRKFLRRHKGPVAAGLALAALLLLGIVCTSLGLAWALRAERTATAERDRAQTAEQLATDRLLEATQQKERATSAEKLATNRLLDVTKEKERATAAEVQAKEEAAIAKAVNNFLQYDLLAEAAPDKNPRNKKVTVEEVLGRAAARIAFKFDQQPLVEATIRQTIGDTYHALGDYPAAQPHLERALEVRRRVLGEEHPDTLNAMNNLADLYQDQGRYAQAEPLFVKTLQVSRRVLGEEHPHTLTSMSNLGVQYQHQREFAKAEPLFVKALEVRRRVLGEEHPDTLTAMNNLATLYQAQEHFAKAEPLYVKTLEVSRRVLEEEHSETLNLMNNLAMLYQAQGKFAKAEPLFLKALEVRRRVLGEEHPGTLTVMNNLATLYQAQEQFAKAEPLYVKTLEVSRRVLGEEHPDTLNLMNNLATLYQGQGEFAKAEPLCREALEKIRKRHGEGSKPVAGALALLGFNLLQQEKPAEAEPLLRECLSIRVLKEPEAWTTFNTKSVLGAALLSQKKNADAEPLLLAGYEGMKEREAKIPAMSKAHLTKALERLVKLYDATGQKEKAAEWRRKLEARRDASKQAEKAKEK